MKKLGSVAARKGALAFLRAIRAGEQRAKKTKKTLKG